MRAMLCALWRRRPADICGDPMVRKSAHVPLLSSPLLANCIAALYITPTIPFLSLFSLLDSTRPSLPPFFPPSSPLPCSDLPHPLTAIGNNLPTARRHLPYHRATSKMKLTLTIASALAIIASSAVPQACASNGHTHSVQGGFQKQETFKMLHTRSPSPAQHNIKQNVMDMSHGDLESHRMDQGVQASSASKPKGAKPQPAADDMADPSADYSTSPPFYPTPETAGTGKWAPAVSKAKKLVKKLTNEEKVVLTTGAGWQSGHCVGNINPIERVGFPGLW